MKTLIFTIKVAENVCAHVFLESRSICWVSVTMNFISCFFSLYKDLKLQRMFTLESLFMSSERLIPVLKLCPITKGIIPLSGSKANFDESSWHLLEVGR